jgi:HD-like signal output (HDOD) protein
VRFFSRTTPRTDAVKTKAPTAPSTPPARLPAPPAPKGPRAVAASLAESDVVTLYGTGAVRTVAAGEVLVAAHDAAEARYFIVDGVFELRVVIDGRPESLAFVGRGECLDTCPDAGVLPYTVIAREAGTAIEISAPAFDLLPADLRRTLNRLGASASARRFNALAARHATVAGRGVRLVAAMRSATSEKSRHLPAPLRQALAEIPALPVHARGLAIKLLDDHTYADEIVESIRTDHALASLVLKRANSTHYGLGGQVCDHYRALLLLGTATVYQIMLESAIETVIPEMPEAREAQVRATLISVLAYEIALASRRDNPLVASTVGLLHNVGDSVAMLLRRTRPEAASLLDGVEGPVLGGVVLAGWGLPERVHQVVARQDEAQVLLPDELGEHGDEIAALYLARVCHDLLLERAAPPAHVGEYLRSLGLRESSCLALCREVILPALAKKIDTLPAAVRTRLAGAQALSDRA